MMLIKKLESKHQSVLRSDLCNFSDASIVVKGDITVTNPNMEEEIKQ